MTFEDEAEMEFERPLVRAEFMSALYGHRARSWCTVPL